MHNSQDNDDIITNINVTPLVDIMLVLLIIFMLVSTIVDFSAIKVELPHAATGEKINSETVSVMVSKEGDYYLSGKKLESFKQITIQLKERKALHPDLQVVISADRKVYHEQVVKVIDAIRKLNILKFAINVELLEDV